MDHLHRQSQEIITLSIGTLNTRGFKTKNKRKAIMQQGKDHCDVLMLQDTHLDGLSAKETATQWKGNWGFSNRRTNSGGVAIFSKILTPFINL